MSKEKKALVMLNRKRGTIKAQLTRIKDFLNNPDEKGKPHLESKLDTLKSLRIKLSDILNEYYEVVADDSDLEPLETEILDLEDDCEDIQLAIDDGDKYPLAAEVIMFDVYMDDLTLADDLESGRKLQMQLVSMVKSAGIELYKWSASAEATLANIRNSFWISSARNVIRKILRTCITCRKVSAKGSQQLMADLPAARVTACRVFSQVVKAIHLEIVSDLTTEAFFAALKRFVARRRRPIEIHSDNGRNFDGANNELRKILKALFKGKMEEIIDLCLKNKSNGTSTHLPHHILVVCGRRGLNLKNTI
ncbi:integrase catalytic domain-containing protein [Trichonephila clavipes]|nr:integrase catalytic domain-containing protein [Trichonephila clavipes]